MADAPERPSNQETLGERDMAVCGPGVLVVDDETCVRSLLAAGLAAHGFIVRAVSAGAEAVALYASHRELIDVVLMDVCMPGLDGPATLRALRSINPDIRCCFMSGGLGDHTEDSLRSSGSAVLLRKPFRIEEAARILAAMASPSQLRETPREEG